MNDVTASLAAPAVEETAPRGRPFKPGESGNPNGRPKGSRNRATLAVEALIEGKAEELANKALELALAGDSTLLRALLNNVAPPRRDRTVEFELPKITTAAEACAASAAVLAACAEGKLTPNEAREIQELIAKHVRIIEVAEIEARRLEEHEAEQAQRMAAARAAAVQEERRIEPKPLNIEQDPGYETIKAYDRVLKEQEEEEKRHDAELRARIASRNGRETNG
jgi:hypothetical protein